MDNLQKKNSDEETEEKIKQRKERIKNWIRDYNNLFLIATISLMLIVSLYYFFLTKDQALWWDEAEYMAIAKNWAFNIPYDVPSQRPILFPFLSLVLYKLGFGELGLKFFLVLIPFWIVVVLTYFLIIEIYKDKKIALITAFITAVSWIHLFYTMRLMTDMLGLVFGLAAFYCFWKGYINKGNKIYIWLIGFFVILSALIRLTGVLYGAVILLFLLVVDKFRFFVNKNIWISFFISLLTLSPLFIWGYFKYGSALAFRSGYGGVPDLGIGWYMIKHVYHFPELGFFILFIIGLFAAIPLLFSLDYIIKKQDRKYYGDLFMIISILFTLFFFMYFLRIGENRWLILMSLGIFVFSAKGLLLIYNFVKKEHKSFAIIVLIALILFGAYFQLKHANFIIKNKINTYNEVKEAGLWIKDHSEKGDIIITASGPQTVYYAEREVMSFFNSTENRHHTQEELDAIIEAVKPKYIMISVFEPSVPQWTYTYPQNNETKFKPVRAWFLDREQQQPAMIIYKIVF